MAGTFTCRGVGIAVVLLVLATDRARVTEEGGLTIVRGGSLDALRSLGIVCPLVDSLSFGRLVGAVRDMLDVDRNAGVPADALLGPAVGGPCWELLREGVLDLGGAEPARDVRFPVSFSAAAALASCRIWRILSPLTRNVRPVSASHAGIEAKRSCWSYKSVCVCANLL